MHRNNSLVNVLNRRENGLKIATNEKKLQSFVEEKTATSCNNEKTCELSGSPRSTFLVCFSHDRAKMASSHGDHTIRVANSYTGAYISTLQGHPRTPWCLSFHPSNNNLLASGCLGGEVRIWDLAGGCDVYIPPDRAVIASIAFHPIDNVLLIATSNKIYFWQWDDIQPFACITTNYPEEKVRFVKFSPFGDYILTGITNCAQMDTSASAQQSATQSSVEQVLQSVSCTQLDGDQVTDYIMHQTGGHAQRSQNNGSGPSHMEEAPQEQASGSRLPSRDHPTSNSTATSVPRDTQTRALRDETRSVRNYRGVFALFRARDSGGWNINTSEIDSDPTDVGRSNLLFSGNATESMSVDTVETNNDSSYFGTSASASNTTGIPEEANQGATSGDTSRSSSPGTLASSSPLTSSFGTRTWASSFTSSSSSSMSSSSSNSSVSSNSSSSSLFSRYSDNTSSLANILQDDQIAEMSPLSSSNVQENLMNPEMNESLLSTSGNDDISQSISFLNPSNRPSDVSVSMTSSNVSMDTNDYQPLDSSADRIPTETPSNRVRNVRSSGVNVQIDYDSGSIRENSDRYVSGVGSVVNVGAAMNSRTSYVTHGNNHSSSLSTLSNQDGSGTAIATATARTFRHVHTAVVIANGSEGGPQIALRTAINRAIAGAFAGSGEGAVASNIINTTHRLQWWDFSKCVMPDIKDGNCNVIVPCCKIHNDASCDLSPDGTLLAAFVPSALGFPDDGMLGIYSMKKSNLGQCLFTKKFGPNAISVSISPLNDHVVVGLAARRIQWHLTSQQVMAQVFKLTPDKDRSSPYTELKSPVNSIVLNEEDTNRRYYTSVNAAFWHPSVGCGIVYGTNRGDLRMRQYGHDT